MGSPKCGVCGAVMKRNGQTEAGTQRWRCGRCGASARRRADNTAKLLRRFIIWLLSKRRQSEMGTSARTFQRQIEPFWKIWPILPVCDEIHHVIYIDGLWLKRGRAVLLIARTDEYVIACHLARTENSKDWACLLTRIAPPDVVVTDGSGGILKALRAMWPKTRVQRCTFHAFEQVRRCTTSRPNLQAGVELYGIAKDLLQVGSEEEAAKWLASFSDWCTRWQGFLKERTVVDGRVRYKHERLRKARRGLEKLCREGTLFTYLDETLLADGPLKPTNNTIEGGTNAQIRNMLREHRGMDIEKRIKAGFWYCYMNSEAPMGYARMLREFPTDEQVMEWRHQAAKADQEGEVARWGTGIVWSEFHTSGSKSTGWF